MNTLPSPIQLFVYQGLFLQSCFLDSQPLASTDCTGLSFPRCKMSYLLLSNFMMFMPAYVSKLSRSLWISALPSSVLTAFPILVSSTNSLREPCIPSSSSLMKTLKSIGHSIDPWGTPLVTSQQLQLCTTDIHFLNSAVQPIFHPPYHSFIQPISNHFGDKEAMEDYVLKSSYTTFTVLP